MAGRRLGRRRPGAVAALLAPDRVAGLVLFGTAVSGAPEPELDPDTQRFDALLDAAIAAGNLEEVNRLATWLWLDGPSSPEGRVGGEARALALDMNAIILRNGAREDEGGSGVDAWRRLDEVQVLVTVACGDLDVPFLPPAAASWPAAWVAAATASCPGWRSSLTWSSPAGRGPSSRHARSRLSAGRALRGPQVVSPRVTGARPQPGAHPRR